MSRVHHKASLPTPDDVEALLEAAREAADYRYHGLGHLYVRGALCKLFTNSIEYLKHDVDVVEILLETVQDEHAILNRHNRAQAKALSRGRMFHDLSNELINFPFRYLARKRGVKLPPGLEPIYQLTDDHDPEQLETARQRSASIDASSNISGPLTASATTSKRVVKNVPGSIGKCYDAPSPEHDFPNANITLAELAALLPQSIKSWDIADRILWNDAATEDIANLINKHRTMPAGTIEHNSVYLMMRGQMRRRTQQEHGYRRWSSWIVGAQANVQKPATFNSDSISVTGFRRPQIFQNRPYVAANPIPFAELANGVAVWPQGGDALDLTRMIAWCVENPNQQYYYPNDYQQVLTIVGGPVTPQKLHTDAAVLARLRSGPTIQSRRPPTSQKDRNLGSDEGGHTQLIKRKRGASHIKKNRKLVNTTAPKPTRETRKSSTRTGARQSILDVDSEDDTDDEAYQGPKRAKKNKDAPRRSGRKKTTISYAYDAVSFDEEEEEEEEEEEDEAYLENADVDKMVIDAF